MIKQIIFICKDVENVFCFFYLLVDNDYYYEISDQIQMIVSYLLMFLWVPMRGGKPGLENSIVEFAGKFV